MDISAATRKFKAQRYRAECRGIPFHLTLQEWLEMWGDKLDKRGRNLGEYVMCRKNDTGPYSTTNAYIATCSHNASVRGYKATRTNASHLGDFPDRDRFWRGDPLGALIAQEEADA